MTDEISKKASKIKSDIATLDKIIFPAGISDELFGELKEWIGKQKNGFAERQDMKSNVIMMHVTESNIFQGMVICR